MKKLITIIIVASLALTIQAQDITNKIGSGGEFDVLNSNDQILFKVHNTGWTGTTGEFEFNSHDGGSTIVHITDAGHNNKLYFDYAKGTTATKEDVSSGSNLGIINFNGWATGNYRLGASINAIVSGTVSGTTVPTDLEFHTQETGLTVKRMVIKSDGKVGIGTDTPNSTLNVNGSLALPLTLAFSSRTLNESEYTIIASGTITLTLPDSNGIEGRIYVIKKENDTNKVTIDPGSGHTIDGFEAFTLDKAYQYIIVQASGPTHWVIIGGN